MLKKRNLINALFLFDKSWPREDVRPKLERRTVKGISKAEQVMPSKKKKRCRTEMKRQR